MAEKILVTYASRTGSTAGVAEAIGKTLSAGGLQVDVLPMKEVDDLSAYGGIVAGSAIQHNQWLPEAQQFLQVHREHLKQKPYAMFSVCMTLAMENGESYRPQVAKWVAPERELVPPISEGLFAGVLDISRIASLSDRLKFRLSVISGVWQEGDHRDWEAIRAWARELYPRFLARQAVT